MFGAVQAQAFAVLEAVAEGEGLEVAAGEEEGVEADGGGDRGVRGWV